MSNTNASAIQRGFHYQDMVGLIEFLDNIENVKAVNVEGEDDIDLIFENDRIYYYQAKETIKPHDGKMSGEFKDALKTLDNDAQDDNMERIIYVSNSLPAYSVEKLSLLWGQRGPASYTGFGEMVV